MLTIAWKSHCFMLFTLLSISSGVVSTERHLNQHRDIFSGIESFADSIFGISATESAQPTTAAATTSLTVTTTPENPTTSANSQVLTVSPTPAATTTASPSQTTSTVTTSEITIRSSESLTIFSSPTTVVSSTSTSSSSTTSFLNSESSSTSSASLTRVTSSATPIQGLPSNSTYNPPIDSSGNHVSAAGIAVAVVFSALILAGVVYLFYKQFPTLKEKFSYRHKSDNDELKQISQSGLDEEKGLTQGKGLGRRKVTELSQGNNTGRLQADEPYKPRRRATSEDTLVPDPTLPMSLFDRKDSRQSPLPPTEQTQWPIVAPINASLPLPKAVRRKPVGGYAACKGNANSVINLSIAPAMGNLQIRQSSDTLPAELPETQVRSKFGEARQISGVHELL